MKFIALVFLSLFSTMALSQVIVEGPLKFNEASDAKNFEGDVKRATHTKDWPVETYGLRISEVRFDKKGKTNWHRHNGAQYLFATEGIGEVEFYNEKGELINKVIPENGKVYIPSGVCHRHGSREGVFRHIYVTQGSTSWDNCHQEFTKK